MNSSQDPRVPLRQIGEKSTISMSVAEVIPSQVRIESMAMNEKETHLYVITSQG